MAQPRRKENESESEQPNPVAEVAGPSAEGWTTPRMPSRLTMGVFAGLVVLFNIPLLHYFVFRSAPAVTAPVPYQNDFSDPGTVEKDFFSTGGRWRVEGGQLVSPGVKNNPLWLRASLPQDVAVEFDVRTLGSAMGAGDVKVEIFGDGSDHASGYVLIHGGWNNTVSIIARLDEHATALPALEAQARETARVRGLPTSDLVQTGVYRKDTRVRVETNATPPENLRIYHWRIERRGRLLTWFIDGREYLRFDDPYPLGGKGNDRFAFSSWESQLYFDNLRIQPL